MHMHSESHKKKRLADGVSWNTLSADSIGADLSFGLGITEMLHWFSKQKEFGGYFECSEIILRWILLPTLTRHTSAVRSSESSRVTAALDPGSRHEEVLLCWWYGAGSGSQRGINIISIPSKVVRSNCYSAAFSPRSSLPPFSELGVKFNYNELAWFDFSIWENYFLIFPYNKVTGSKSMFAVDCVCICYVQDSEHESLQWLKGAFIPRVSYLIRGKFQVLIW